MINMEAEKIEIRKVIKRIELAENQKDVDSMFYDMTEDAILHKPGSPQIQGIDAWREDYAKFFNSGFISTKLTTLDIDISTSGDMAWENGIFISEFEGSNGPTRSEGKYIGIYKKIDGKWKGVAVCITNSD